MGLPGLTPALLLPATRKETSLSLQGLWFPICAIRLWTSRGLKALGTLACLMHGRSHTPDLSPPPRFCPGPTPPQPAGGPAHRGPAACCQMGRWTRTPPAGGRPGAAETPASLQTLFAVTLAVVKTSPSIQALQAPHADGLFSHQRWWVSAPGEGEQALGPSSESRDLDPSCPTQEPLVTCGQ